ncbi:MAG: hypothetical protein ACI9OJ_004689, partial [Myxococcota bacterium]
MNKLRRLGLFLVLAAALSGCAGDSSDSTTPVAADTDVSDVGPAVPDVPDVEQIPDPPAVCAIAMKVAPGLTGRTSTFEFQTGHPLGLPLVTENPMLVGNVQVAVVAGSCADPKPNCIVTDLTLNDKGGGFYEVVFNPAGFPAECLAELSNDPIVAAQHPETGSYCLIMNAEVLPENPHESWGEIQCGEQHPFEVDADGPMFIQESPVPYDATTGVGIYYRTMPVTLAMFDRSEIVSAQLMWGEISLAELEFFESGPDKYGAGVFEVIQDIDVCALGTGLESLVVITEDQWGNTNSEEFVSKDLDFEVQVARCLNYQTVRPVVPLNPEAAPTYFQVVNYDDDDDEVLEVLAATPEGVALYLNNNGNLEASHVLPGIEASTRRFVADDLDGQGPLDIVAVHGGDTTDHISTYVWGCVPDQTPFEGMTDDERKDWVIAHGGSCPACIPQYVEVDRVDVPARVTTHLYGNLSSVAGGEDPAKRKDFIFGTDADQVAIGIMLGREDGKCAYVPPVLAADTCHGLEEEEDEGSLSSCFVLKSYVDASAQVGSGGVSTIAMDDFIHDPNNLSDLAIGYAGLGALGIIEHKGAGAFAAPDITVGLPSPVVQLIPQHFGEDPITGQRPKDLLVVMKEAQEIWQMYGTGSKPWALYTNEIPPVPAARRTCIEGKPAKVYLGFLDEQPISPNPLPDLLVANFDAGTLWSMQ